MIESGLIYQRPQRVKAYLKEGSLSICIIGLGRIGLPTAALFAQSGAQVMGVDIARKVVEMVNSGECRFIDEPELSEILSEVVSKNRLKATDDFSTAVPLADVIIICVPTPVDQAKTPDYSSISTASREVGRHLRKGSLVIIESTVGPGVIEDSVLPILEKESGLRTSVEFGVASCPERSDPGNIVKNMRTIPRIVGGVDSRSTDIAAALYEAGLQVRIIKVSNPKTANAVKLTENLFRDVNIALANEFALLYEKLGIDVIEVISACASKYNFMPHFPGAGVGGPCLPSNPYYLIVEGTKVGNIPYLVRMAREINDRMPEHVVSLVSEALNEIGKTVRGSKIAILGVAYKPNVKDCQLSPVGKIYSCLREMSAKISLYDPMFKGESVFGQRVENSITNAVAKADCILIGTAHREFYSLDFERIAELARNPAALVDSQHVVDPSYARRCGFAYCGVGRPKVLLPRENRRLTVYTRVKAG